MTQDSLTAEGYELQVATEREEALAEAMAKRPHLIGSDLMLSHIDGYELCRRLGANPPTSKVPISCSPLAEVSRRRGRASKEAL